MKGEIENSTIVVEGFNTTFSVMDIAIRQKNDNKIEGLNKTINQVDKSDIYRILLPPPCHQQQNTYFSQIHMQQSIGYTTI